MQLWGRRPHFFRLIDANRQKGYKLWGQRPHYFRVEPIKTQISVQLATIGVADFQMPQFCCQFGKEVFTVSGSVCAMEFILGNVTPYQPVAQSQTNIYSSTCLCSQFTMKLQDGSDQCLKI